MAIKKYKPTSPGRRGMTSVVRTDSSKNKPHKPLLRKLQCVYYFLSVAALANDLVAIVYATVACNKLTEVAAPAAIKGLWPLRLVAEDT